MRCIEKIDFGPSSGTTDIVQLSGEAFQSACLQANSMIDDSTGLRIHGGAHVAIRFLLMHPHLIEDMKICEVGCGTGVYGLIGTRGGSISAHLALTDGNAAAVTIALQNTDQLVSATNLSKVSCAKLLWGSDDYVDDLIESLGTVLSQHSNEVHGISSEFIANHDKLSVGQIENADDFIGNKNRHFDIVIGCELFYYRTNIDELLSTVLRLTKNAGLFIHSHVFRRSGQDLELIEYLSRWNWSTAVIPIQRFVSQKELEEHPEWFSVHCLVSGPADRISELLISENRARSANIGDVPSLFSSDNADSNNELSENRDFQWRIFEGASALKDSAQSESECEDFNDDIDLLSTGNLFS